MELDIHISSSTTSKLRLRVVARKWSELATSTLSQQVRLWKNYNNNNFSSYKQKVEFISNKIPLLNNRLRLIVDFAATVLLGVVQPVVYGG